MKSPDGLPRGRTTLLVGGPGSGKSMRALTDGIFMARTLIKLAPSPVRGIVGALSRTPPVLQALGPEVLAA